MTAVTTVEPTAEDQHVGDIHGTGTSDTMFSARTVPWMKLGKLVEGAVTAADAAKLGGIDFAVREEDVYRATKAPGRPPKFTKIEGRKAIVRDDTDLQLSIVSTGYPVVQYAEAFDFMDAISPHFVAAGALRGGRQAFMVVDTGITINALDDTTRIYGVLRTSHDCSRAVEVSAMPLRQRCMNQLTLRSFAKDAKYRWSIVHAGNVKSKLQAAGNTMTQLSVYGRVYESTVERLAAIKVTDERSVEVLRWALPDRPKRDEMITTILSGWHTKTEEVGYEGTGWGLVNAVSEHMEWGRAMGTPESRFLGALQGATHKAINRVATLLLTRA